MTINKEQNLDWHVGLQNSFIMTSWGWHLGDETVRSCHNSQMVYHRVQMLDDTRILTVRTCTV